LFYAELSLVNLISICHYRTFIAELATTVTEFTQGSGLSLETCNHDLLGSIFMFVFCEFSVRRISPWILLGFLYYLDHYFHHVATTIGFL